MEARSNSSWTVKTPRWDLQRATKDMALIESPAEGEEGIVEPNLIRGQVQNFCTYTLQFPLRVSLWHTPLAAGCDIGLEHISAEAFDYGV